MVFNLLMSEWKRRRSEWDQHVTRIDADRVVKISRDNVSVGRRSPDILKERLVKYHGTLYLSEEDLQNTLKENGAT